MPNFKNAALLAIALCLFVMSAPDASARCRGPHCKRFTPLRTAVSAPFRGPGLFARLTFRPHRMGR